jgi:hypothetical protein
MSVYPNFPSNPDPGDLFPVAPDPDESQFVYLSDQVGWVSKTVALQDVETGNPIWPGKLTKITAFPPSPPSPG